jgi:putative inorganic carbon (hco3(-)) transporter
LPLPGWPGRRRKIREAKGQDAMLDKIVYICLLVLVFSIPFEIDLRRFGVNLPYINTTLEILMAITFLFWFLKKIRDRKFIRSPFDAPIIAFVSINLFSVFFIAMDPYWALKFVLRLAGGIFLYYIVTDMVRKKEHVRDILGVLVLSSVIVAVVGVGEKYFLREIGWFLNMFSFERSYLNEVGGLLRVSSTFIYTNVLAMYIEMIFPVIAGLFLFEMSDTGRVSPLKSRLYFFLALFLTQILIFTYSRAGFIVLYLTLGVMALLLRLTKNTRSAGEGGAGKSRFRDYKAVLALGVIVGVLYGITAYWDFNMERRFVNMVDVRYHPNAQRIYIWESALKVMKGHPLFGIGPDNFRWAYACRYARSSPYFKFNPLAPVPGVDTNNVYLEVLVSLGIIGAISYFWLVLKHFFYFMKNLLLYKNRYFLYVSIGVCGSFAAYFIHGMVDSFGSYQSIVFLFWLMLAFMAVLPKIEKEDTGT